MMARGGRAVVLAAAVPCFLRCVVLVSIRVHLPDFPSGAATGTGVHCDFPPAGGLRVLGEIA